MSLEEYAALLLYIAVYAEDMKNFFSAPTKSSAVSTAVLVVLANASLGGNVTRIASVPLLAAAPNALGLANASLGGNVTRIAIVPSPPPIDHCNWSYSKTGMVQASTLCPLVSIQLPDQSKVPVLSMTGILQPVPKPESQPELKEFLCCKYIVKMYGLVYERLIELQRRRKIPNFRPWPSEFSLQVRTDSKILEISNVTFSEWEEINKRDKKIRELRREEINERDKKIRELRRLATKEILPIRLFIFLYQPATQFLQQCKRFVAEVQLVVDKAFNYVSLLVLGPVLVVLCCLVRCEDDRSSLCWVFKLVSKFHPILGICVHVCEEIAESSTHTQPPQRTVRVSDEIVDSSDPTQPPQMRVRFSNEITEFQIPTQPLSSAPDGGLETETRQQRIERLIARARALSSPR